MAQPLKSPFSKPQEEASPPHQLQIVLTAQDFEQTIYFSGVADSDIPYFM